MNSPRQNLNSGRDWLTAEAPVIHLKESCWVDAFDSTLCKGTYLGEFHHCLLMEAIQKQVQISD